MTLLEECTKVKVQVINIGTRSDDYLVGFEAGCYAYIDAIKSFLSSEPFEARIQLDALRALQDTEEGDIDFLLDQLKINNNSREVIKSFRKQLIIASAMSCLHG